MDDDAIPKAVPSNWQPMTKLSSIALLGKLNEELGELVSAASRCLIQGLNANDPETGKPNKAWLEEEVADVYSKLDLTIRHFHLDVKRIIERAARKTIYTHSWLDSLNTKEQHIEPLRSDDNGESNG